MSCTADRGGPHGVGDDQKRIPDDVHDAVDMTAEDFLQTDDHQHMGKVTGYVERHLAEGPPRNDVEHSRWQYSLMDWGHDPLGK